jgi:hypothetical protein
VTILIPSLVPNEKCIKIPKEVCTKVQVPRKVKRTSVRLQCDGSANENKQILAAPSQGITIFAWATKGFYKMFLGLSYNHNIQITFIKIDPKLSSANLLGKGTAPVLVLVRLF